MLQITHRINGAVLWANLYLLFWLSLFPFVTAWLNRSEMSRLPVALYGLVLPAFHYNDGLGYPTLFLCHSSPLLDGLSDQVDH